MDLLWLVNKIRYMKPIENFFEIKGFILPLAFFSTILTRMMDLIKTDWDLVIVLFVAVILDTITGIIASKRRKNPLNSLGLRQTIVKIIEYTIFIGIMVMLSNGVEKYTTANEIGFLLERTADFMKDVDIFAFLTIIWIEIVSITENLSDKKGAIKRTIKEITEKIFKKTDK